MRKILLGCVFAMVAMPAMADVITLTATVDGVLAGTTSSNTGQLDVTGVALGPYSLNTITADSQTVLPGGGLLNTNSLNLQQTNTGSHSLVLDIVASGLTGPGALASLLSTFSVTGLTAGWTADERTTINGNLLVDTGVFTTPVASAFSTNSAFLGNTFSADVHYTITSNGVGGFNGGIDIGVVPVPAPVLGAGLSGLIIAALGLVGLNRRRRNLA